MTNEVIQAERRSVVAEARSWIGTPYHHMGRVKGAGIDCAMLLCEVYEKALQWCPRLEVEFYPMDWHLHRGDERILEVIEFYAEEVETPEPGDIVVFRFGRCFSHCAIVTDWPHVIHAHMGGRMVMIDSVTNSKELEPRVRRFYSPWRKSLTNS